jgi:hypothetical protein
MMLNVSNAGMEEKEITISVYRKLRIPLYKTYRS